ncbi:hypothetical protein [Endozoicomonas lisbonensis]|uniref:Uncharacterized protein n=1 Tax=Endozoicomonas lisbonensis TaxID=3120522 RepID=A0ABV2SG04_9GAMM
MPLIQAWELSEFAREYFRGTLKTANKVYSLQYGSVAEDDKLRRNSNRQKAFQSHIDLCKHPVQSRIEILETWEQEKRCGNCLEYAQIAANEGIKRKIPNIWLASYINGLHVFLVLTDTPAQFDIMPIKDFKNFEQNDFFVCDPWFNISCKLCLYHSKTFEKACDWNSKGKEITSKLFRTGEPAIQWFHRLADSKIEFCQITNEKGEAVSLGYDIF